MQSFIWALRNDALLRWAVLAACVMLAVKVLLI
jgi:hypothetical protein